MATTYLMTRSGSGASRSPSSAMPNKNAPGSPFYRDSSSVDARVLLFHCRKESENTAVDVKIQAGVTYFRFIERLTNEFSRIEVQGFSYFSTATREEVQVCDENSFLKCKGEMIALKDGKEENENVEIMDEESDVYSIDITVKVHLHVKHSASGTTRTTEEAAAWRRERAGERQARMKDLERLFEDLSAANSTGSKGGASSSSQSTTWRVHYPLHAAAEAGDVSQVQQLLDAPRENLMDSKDGLERNALHYAASRGRLQVVEALLSKGARVDTPDVACQTPLHKAAAGGHHFVCRTLALAMADVNAVDTHQLTPLMLAAKAAHVDSVQVLLRHGARTSDTDLEGNTALWHVPEHAAALRLLLSDQKGDLRVQIEEGASAVHASNAGAITKGVPEHEQLNLAKNNIVTRLKKMASRLEAMDLRDRASAVQVMRQLGGIEAGLQTPELAVARLEKLHLNRHNIL